jgi:hypothetical protein
MSFVYRKNGSSILQMQKNKTRHTSKVGPIILIAIGFLMILFTIWSLVVRNVQSSQILPEPGAYSAVVIPAGIMASPDTQWNGLSFPERSGETGFSL